jgi:hypothetical protein
MLYEIRNYWYDPEHFEEYVKWGKEVTAPYFRSVMDIVGFWYSTDIPHIYGGSLPHDDGMVPANFTWIIRWKDKEEREKVWSEIRGTEEWKKAFSVRPGKQEYYLRQEVKFTKEM